MKSYDDDWIAEEHRDRHVLAASTAAAISLLLHAAVMYVLIAMNVSWPIPAVEKLQTEARRILRVRTVDPGAEDESAIGKDRGLGEDEARRPLGTIEDMRRQVEALRTMPDPVAVAPTPVPVEVLTGEAGALTEPVAFPEMGQWDPRQEIVAIDKRLAADELSELPRRVVPRIERSVGAPDVSMPVDTRAAPDGGSAFGVDAARLVPPADTVELAPAPAALHGLGVDGGPSVDVRKPESATGGELFEEHPTEITDIRPVEALLRASVTVYTALLDFKFGYFRIQIDRTSDEDLPAIPKDVVFLQDSSNSMGEQRMFFCRNGIVRAMKLLDERDRFNVVAFRDRVSFCFPDWTPASPENMQTAQAFTEALTATGNTDILASLRTIRNLPKTPGRPVIAIMITDGLPTAGIVSSSGIIREFTRLNDGAASVYTLGTIRTANTYLLDILSYANRGETRTVNRGRWDIPDAIEALLRELSQPVLTDIRLRFAQPEQFEIYPIQTSNLYGDRPIVLYGRFARENERLVMQAVGKAGELPCDMIFDLDLAFAPRSSDRDIRREWARQKIYHLVGQYARKGDPAVLSEIRSTASAYGVSVPHEDMIGK